MKKYRCKVCGWIYDEAKGDPDNGIAPGTRFEDLPAEFICPLCGAPKEAVKGLTCSFTPFLHGKKRLENRCGVT